MDYSVLLGALALATGAVLLAARLGNAGPWMQGRAVAVTVSTSRMLFPVFLLVFLLRAFLFEPFRIPSASMMPTLLVGDFILVTKYDYGLRMPLTNARIVGDQGPRRGDVVVFRYPGDPSESYIKRIVGLPGDRLRYRGKKLYINGEPVPLSRKGRAYSGAELWEEHLGGMRHDILVHPRKRAHDLELTVPPDAYFVLGDNRDNSRDSRSWGFVPDRLLVGKALLVWLNWDGGIGWERIGKSI